MIFYKFLIGHYQSKTARLTWEQDLAYRRLLDEYYALEEPLPLEREQWYLIARCVTPKQRRAVDYVRERYFTAEDDGCHNAKADQVIEEATTYSESQSAKGKKGGRPKKSRGLTGDKPEIKPGISPGKAIHKPQATNQNPEATILSSTSRSVEEKEEKKHRPSTDRPTDSRNNGYRPSLKHADELNSLMFCATGKAETTSTAHAWLKTTRSAGSFERIKQVLELKLRKHKPKSNAWFKAVLTDQFGISPEDAKAERRKYIERYREAIRLTDPEKRKAAAQACSEEAAEAGVSVLNSI